MAHVIIASPTSPLRRSPRLAATSTDGPSDEQRADAGLSPLRLANKARSSSRGVFSPEARSPTGRPPPIPKSALRTKNQIRSRTRNVIRDGVSSHSSSSGFTDHNTPPPDGRQSKSWGNVGWLLVITISFFLAGYAVRLDVGSSNTSRTSEDKWPLLAVRQALENIQADISRYSDRVKMAKEVQEKHHLAIAGLREGFDKFIMRLNVAESLMGNLLGAEGPDDAAVMATRVLQAQSDLQEVQAAAASGLSEVNTKLETQRSIMVEKGLKFHNLAKQLQSKGIQTFGPRLHALEKETTSLVEFLAMNEESINLLKSVVGNTVSEGKIDGFVSELRSGVITNDDAHLALFKVDDILEALRGNVTRAVQGLAKEEKMECMNIESTDQLIREAIIRFKANRTGQKDFARHVTGGRVVYSKGFTSPTYYPEGNGFPIRMLRMIGADVRVGQPEEALSNDMRIGSCWAMVGQKGQLTVQLSEPIRITAVSIEHVSSRMTPNLSSAPQEFLVFGIQNVSITSGNYPEHPQLLVSGRYDLGGPTIQTYQAESHSTVYNGISIHILSNHGDPDESVNGIHVLCPNTTAAAAAAAAGR